MIEAIILSSALSIGNCPIKGAEEQYSYFYHHTYKDTGVNANGENTSSVKSVTKDQANKSWSCLIKAANKNNCSALYTLQLFYKTGALSSIFGFTKNQSVSQKYGSQYNEFCANKNA